MAGCETRREAGLCVSAVVAMTHVRREVTYAGPVTAWRQWRVTQDGQLRSLVMDYTWEPGWQTAMCLPWPARVAAGQPSREPRPLCRDDDWLHHQCGFWGLHDEMMAVRRVVLRGGAALLVGPSYGGELHRAVGEIEMAGRFARGEHGWRVERARVVRLVEPTLSMARRWAGGLVEHHGEEWLGDYHVVLVARARAAGRRYKVPVDTIEEED